jgi:hypothetical protein
MKYQQLKLHGLWIETEGNLMKVYDQHNNELATCIRTSDNGWTFRNQWNDSMGYLDEVNISHPQTAIFLALAIREEMTAFGI